MVFFWGQFNLSHPNLSSNPDLAQNDSLPITITFQPKGESGLRNELLLINSNDPANPVYTANLSGMCLSDSSDSYGDGMADWVEFSLSGFGFDCEGNQENLVDYRLQPDFRC